MADLKEDLAALRIEREPSSVTSRRWIGWLVAVVLLGAAGLGAWFWFTRERPVEVEAATVTVRAAGTQAAVLNATGYVTARRRATVSSKITGKVVEVNVEEGMAVKEGQILARLDDVDDACGPGAGRGADRGRPPGRSRERSAARRGRGSRWTGCRSCSKIGVSTEAELDAASANVDSTAARIDALRQQTAVAERQVGVAADGP